MSDDQGGESPPPERLAGAQQSDVPGSGQGLDDSDHQGGESPPPERLAGAQQSDVPGSGQGTDETSNKAQINKDQLKNLSSNPKGPLDDVLVEKFAKTIPAGTDSK